jgi:hypothetical protein
VLGKAKEERGEVLLRAFPEWEGKTSRDNMV